MTTIQDFKEAARYEFDQCLDHLVDEIRTGRHTPPTSITVEIFPIYVGMLRATAP